MDERIYITIAKVLANDATEAEKQELNEWLSANPEHVAQMEEMEMIWQQSDKLFASWPSCNVSAAWDKISARICTNTNPSASKSRSFIPAWLKYSATVAAMLVIGVFFFYSFSEVKTLEIVAANANKEITLPDHSHIVLHKGSTIKYPEKFAANERHVALKGEAFFEVSHDEQHPFVIDAQSAEVKVLGTSFNVACDANAATVTVKTGKVQVATHNNTSGKVVLTHGQRASLKDGVLNMDSVANLNYLYWKTKELDFRQQPLASVLQEISSISGVKIQFVPSLSAKSRQQLVDIHFNQQTVQEMLVELCLITNTRLISQNNTYFIAPK